MTPYTAPDPSIHVSKGPGWGISLVLFVVGVLLFAAVMVGLVALLGGDEEVDGTSGGRSASSMSGAPVSLVHG